MKIVVNKCFGGFGVTVQILKELVIRNSEVIEACTPINWYGGEKEKFAADWEKKWEQDFKNYVSIGDGFMAENGSDYLVYKDGMIYTLKDFYDSGLRSNKDLIEAIESIGVDNAGSTFAKLEIIEIPDGIEWHIDNYDGIETIHENHRSW